MRQVVIPLEAAAYGYERTLVLSPSDNAGRVFSSACGSFRTSALA